MWVDVFAKSLLRLAVESGNAEKANFAKAFAYDIGLCYWRDPPWDMISQDPHEAARFEFDCWKWWGRKGKLGLPERA